MVLSQLQTPNNDNNKGDCPGEVGHDQGGFCKSRTWFPGGVNGENAPPNSAVIATSPFHFTNVRMQCTGGGCGWADPEATLSGPLSAQGYIDNWGLAVTGTLFADRVETMSSTQCQSSGSIPVINGQTVVLNAQKDCLPIARVAVHSEETQSDSDFAFAQQTGPRDTIQLSSSSTSGDFTIATYALTIPQALQNKAFAKPLWMDTRRVFPDPRPVSLFRRPECGDSNHLCCDLGLDAGERYQWTTFDSCRTLQGKAAPNEMCPDRPPPCPTPNSSKP
jgi:hypothetical protein